MIVTSTHSVEGRQISEYLGVVAVRGNIYRAGTGGVPRREHPELHRDIMADLVDQALPLGADALVGVAITTAGKSNESAIYTATAVRLLPA